MPWERKQATSDDTGWRIYQRVTVRASGELLGLEGQVGGTRMDMTPNQQRGQSSPTESWDYRAFVHQLPTSAAEQQSPGIKKDLAAENRGARQHRWPEVPLSHGHEVSRSSLLYTEEPSQKKEEKKSLNPEWLPQNHCYPYLPNGLNCTIFPFAVAAFLRCLPISCNSWPCIIHCAWVFFEPNDFLLTCNTAEVLGWNFKDLIWKRLWFPVQSLFFLTLLLVLTKQATMR